MWLLVFVIKYLILKVNLNIYLISDEDFEPHIISENKHQNRKRLKLVDDTFGTNTQPTLEKIEFKVLAKWLNVLFPVLSFFLNENSYFCGEHSVYSNPFINKFLGTLQLTMQ